MGLDARASITLAKAHFRMCDLDSGALRDDLAANGTVVMKSWLVKNADEMESDATSVAPPSPPART
jgi:hypothetical protein